ncbi:MAG: UMP kinase [Candidatus Woykebacteria bacterium]
MNVTVISLGGSLIVPNGGPDPQFLKAFRKTILKFTGDGRRFLIVAGGGMTTRSYQQAAKKIIDLPDEDVDWLGIHVTHLNGHLLRTVFRDKAHLKVLTHYNEKADIPEPITIAAGWKPGHSTDYDTVMFAALYGSDTVVNLSNVPFVYDKDPNENKDAKPLREISWGDFRKIVGETWIPGDNLPFDPIASKKAQEANLKVVIMDGHNLQNFENFLQGKDFEGTVIK